MGRKIIKVGEKPGLMDDQGKQFIHQSSRPISTNTFYTGVDDNDNFIEFVHAETEGQGAGTPVYIDLNCRENNTYIHEALIQWKNAERDCVSAKVVTTATTTSAGSDYGITAGLPTDKENGVILPGPIADLLSITKDKTFTNTDAKPIMLSPDADTGVQPSGYWDISLDSNGNYDYATLAENLGGTGNCNLYDSERDLKAFVRKVPMIGSSSAWNILPSSDTAKLGDGMRIKLTFETRGTADHAWECSVAVILHRQRTL